MTIVYTVVTRNYLHQARVLMRSVATHLPDAERHVLVVDPAAGLFDPKQEPFHVTFGDELGLPEFRTLAFLNTAPGFCCMLKPKFALHLFERTGARRLIYADADTRFYAAPQHLLETLDHHAVALSPHASSPRSPDARREDRHFIESGAYNAGLIGFAGTPAGRQALEWWWQSMLRTRVAEQRLCWDQHWLNLLPAYFPNVAVLRNGTANVAYWNLHDASLTRDSAGRWLVAGEPLEHFHFSYFNPATPTLLANHPPWLIYPATHAPLLDLLCDYADHLAQAGAAETQAWGYGFAQLQDGSNVTDDQRTLLADALAAVATPNGDPFARDYSLPAWKGKNHLAALSSSNSPNFNKPTTGARGRTSLSRLRDLRSLVPSEHPARRYFRRTRDTLNYLGRTLRTGTPDLVVTFGQGGIGDSLLCSAVCREFQRRAPRRIWLLTPHPTLFEGNPDIAATLPFNEDLVQQIARRGIPIARPHYNVNHWEEGRDDPPKEHLIAALCRAGGIAEGEVALRPYLHLAADELKAGAHGPRQIAIHSSGRSARFFMRTKEWFPERFAEVCEALRAEHTLVQLGGADDPLLPGVVDLRGKTTVRETAAILAQSELFIGLVGFLMHLARAVDCPSVIVYGGREKPEQSGYVANTNLARSPACSPCWLWHRCDNRMVCMDTISSAEVVAAARHRLAQARAPLSVTVADLSLPIPDAHRAH